MIAVIELPTAVDDPLWPLPLLGLAAVLLVGITLWTYYGVAGAGPVRVLALLAVRLFALVLACLALLRPALAFPEDQEESTLLILVDSSRSMTFADAPGNQTRWNYLRRTLEECEPQLGQLEARRKVRVVRHRFAHELGDYDPDGQADGLSTDFGQALNSLYKTYSRQRRLRGLIVLSDGAKNGRDDDARALAGPWHRLPCPIHTFAIGDPTTNTGQKDILVDRIEPIPSPVAVKGKLTVKGTIRATGFRNQKVTVRLLVEDQEVKEARQDVVLKGDADKEDTTTEVSLVTDAPPTQGEIKVTLKVDPQEGEVNRDNNELSTFVRVTKEGLKVLYVEGKYRAWEPKFIRQVLSEDPRIRLDEAVLLNVERPPDGEADWFQLDKLRYDVIIIGDISPNRLSGGDDKVLEKIKQLVEEKGTGLMMIGGYETFTSRKKEHAPAEDNRVWSETPFANLLPVELDEDGQVERHLRMVPTEEGLKNYGYVLRLVGNDLDNKAVWANLPVLTGMTKLGTPKQGATVLARADNGVPLLVGWQKGKGTGKGGRVLAFGGDTTWRWRRTDEGIRTHAAFWKKVVLWLAQQDKDEGSVWVRPDPLPAPAGSHAATADPRRVRVGDRFRFQVGLRTKNGLDVPGGSFKVTVRKPEGTEVRVDTATERGAERGIFGDSKADMRMPGEYRIHVQGRGKSPDGKEEIEGQAEMRFLAYQDDVEMQREAANYDFLRDLATESGGEFHEQASDLAPFLRKLVEKTVPATAGNARTWPQWRRNTLSPFLVTFFLLFVGVLCLEWGMRRYWGLA
jgi:uncharacterized membrane protein